MHALLLGLLIAATAAILFFAGARYWNRGADQQANPSAVTQPAAAKSADLNKSLPFSRAEIARRLKILADDPSPANLKRTSAMCYDTGKPRDTIDYICSKDGSRTQYPKRQFDAYLAALEAKRLSATVDAISLVRMSIDSTELCKKCRPNITNPKLVLVVKMPDSSKEHRFHGVAFRDIQLLQEFIEGKRIHETVVGVETIESPLKDHLPRLQELLGVTLPK